MAPALSSARPPPDSAPASDPLPSELGGVAAAGERRFLLRAVVSVALAVFVGELLVMGLLFAHPAKLSPLAEALADATVLLVLTVPSVVFAVVIPMRRRIAAQVAELEDNVRRLAWLSRAFASAQDSILVTDAQANIMSVNPAFTRLTGHRPEDVIGFNPRILASGVHGKAFYEEMWLRLSAGRSWEGRVVDRGRDGQLLDLSMTISPVLDGAGRTTGFVAIHRDLREQLAHEKELARLLEEQTRSNLELESARADAAAASQAKSRFVAAMSHEIRTPLAGLLGTLELLANQPLEGETKALSGVALDSGRALLEVLNGVLDFSKIEAGRMELEDVAFDAASVAHGVGGLFGAEAQSRGLGLELRLPPGPVWVRGDPTRLRQVLANLVGNALKFTSKGSVTVSLDVGDAGLERWWLHFSVSDTGVGIAPAKRAQLFRPFTQADASTTRTHGGTGLGLAICHQLVAQMGGALDVESTEGVGSRFFFALELPAAAPARPSAPPIADQARRARLVGLRVLLAEDNPVIRLVISKLLARLGCVVTVATDGQEALDALERGAAQDVVLMDCQMPRVDGLEAAARIRASPQSWRAVPIIALTASAEDDARRSCLAGGMSGYLAKPATEAALVETLLPFVRAPAAPFAAA